MFKSSSIRAFLLLALVCLLPFAGHSAKTKYFALLIQTDRPQNQILVAEFEINGETKLFNLGRRTPTSSLTKKEYGKLPQITLSQVASFQLADGILRVRTRRGQILQAIPQKFKGWPKGRSSRVAPKAMTGNVRLSGKIAGTKRKHRSSLQANIAVYVYLARPTNDSIAFATTEVQNTQLAYEQFKNRFPNSPHVQIVRERLATTYLRHASNSLAKYEKALTERTPGYPNLAEARTWFNKIQPLNVPVQGGPEFLRRLSRRETRLTNLLRDARQAMEGAQFARAQEILEPIRHFRNEFAEIDTELKNTRAQAAKHYLQQAEKLLASDDFDGALAQTGLAEKWVANSSIPAMRTKIATRRKEYEKHMEIKRATDAANEALKRADFVRAFAALRPVSLRYPREQDLQKRFLAIQQSLRSDLINRSPEVERTYTPLKQGDVAGEKQVLNLYMGLAGLAELNRNDGDVILWRDIMGDYLAAYYHELAKRMAPSQDAVPSALAYAFLQQAYSLALDGTKGQIEELPRWRPQVEENLGLRLGLTVQDSTPDLNSLSVANQLQRLITIGIQRADLPHLELLDARSNRSRETRTIQGQNSLELTIDLSRAAVRDTKKSESIRSEYGAGMRQILNPDWQRAKSDFDLASKKVDDLSAQAGRKMNKRQRTAHQRAMANAQGSLNRARRKLDTTPPYSQEEDIRPYQFSKNTITRTAEIEIAFQWVRHGIVLETDIERRQESIEGTEFTGVERDDKNNHRNQEANLPDKPTMRGRALRGLQKKLSDRFIAYLDAFIAQDFETAKQLTQQNNPVRAAEHYLRYLFNSRPTDTQREEALAYLRNQFNLVTLSNWLVTTSPTTISRSR